MKFYIIEKTDWDHWLKEVQRNLNELPNQTTNNSPFELLFGFVNRHDEEFRKLSIEDEAQYKRAEDRDG